VWPPVDEPQWTQIVAGEDGEERAIMRFPPWEFSLLYLDTAFTEKEENAFCAATRWGVFADSAGRPKVMLAAAWRDRPTLRHLATQILSMCRTGKVDVLVIENRAGAEWVKQELQRLMEAGEFSIVLDEPRGDKVARLHAVSVLFEDGMIFHPDRKWAQMVIDEVSQFPKGRFKDLTDTTSGGLGYLRRSGLIKLAQEHDDDERESRTWKGSRVGVAERYGV
jgi:predicted phage terminase large subunit-like protein